MLDPRVAAAMDQPFGGTIPEDEGPPVEVPDEDRVGESDDDAGVDDDDPTLNEEV